MFLLYQTLQYPLARIDEGAHLAARHRGHLPRHLGVIAVVRFLLPLKRSRQRPGRLDIDSPRLDEIFLNERDRTAVRGRIEIFGRKQRPCGVECGIVESAPGVEVCTAIHKNISGPECLACPFQALAHQLFGFRLHSAMPSRAIARAKAVILLPDRGTSLHR